MSASRLLGAAEPTAASRPQAPALLLHPVVGVSSVPSHRRALSLGRLIGQLFCCLAATQLLRRNHTPLLVLALAFAGCGDFDRREALTYLADNRASFAEVGREFDALVPENMSVGIEYGRFGNIDFSVHWDSAGTDTYIQVWDAPLRDPEVRRGLEVLGWTEQEVERVHELVRSVDGIGIGGPLDVGGVRIRYRRHAMGMYTFEVSDSAMVAEDEIGFDGCSSYYLDSRTSMSYGGPAFGSDCMPPPESW